MKKVCFLLGLLYLFSANSFAQNTIVPDANFEQALIMLGYDTGTPDGIVPTANISSVAILDITNKGISDLTGIEDFTNLRQLQCGDNSLTELDLSNNTSLELLVCFENSITELDLSYNTNLEFLTCSYNELTELNIEGLASLSILYCEANDLVYLDMNTNTALTRVSCGHNKLILCNIRNGNNENIISFSASYNPDLTCIEVDDAAAANAGESPYTYWSIPASASYSTNCVIPYTSVPDDAFEQALIDLGYDSGPLDDLVDTWTISSITNLDLSGFGSIVDLTGIEDFENLAVLNCSNNQIVNLDLSQNTALTSLDCSNNSLAGLNIQNGTNYLITTFNATNNSSLQCIQVDDELKAINGDSPYNVWQKDATTGYAQNCSLYGVMVSIPDSFFENKLISLGYDDVQDGEVKASIVSQITSLTMESALISDLTGIEAFTSLKTLKCNNNLLQTLDLSQLTQLEYLECWHNQLTSLDLSNNTKLTGLNCTNNYIQSLDVSVCPEMNSLICQNNELTEFIFSSNLMWIDVRRNNLQSLDVSNNTDLVNLDCFDNQISSLDVSANTLLTHLDCGYNQMTDLKLNGERLTVLKCYNNQLTSMDLSNYEFLSQFDCRDNLLTTLILNNCPNLWLLRCGGNQLTVLELGEIKSDKAKNTTLVDLDCSDNLFESIDVTNLEGLGSFYCSDNLLTDLDLSMNTDLITLVASNNQLTSLDLSNNSKIQHYELSYNPITEPPVTQTSLADLEKVFLAGTDITSIDLSGYSSLKELYVQESLLDSLDVSANTGLSILNATDLPLSCIQVNENQLNSIPAGWTKDAATTYSVDCNAATYIEGEIMNKKIRIYPNPVSNYLNIKTEVPIMRAEIYSFSGSRIMDITKDFDNIYVGSLPEGIYFLLIESNSGDALFKFMKK